MIIRGTQRLETFIWLIKEKFLRHFSWERTNDCNAQRGKCKDWPSNSFLTLIPQRERGREVHWKASGHSNDGLFEKRVC